MDLINKLLIEASPAAPYLRCRIPGIIPLGTGEALIYYECRRDDSDWAAIDVGCRRVGADGSVGARVILADGRGRTTVNNPVMIAEGATVHFLYCENYKRVFYRRSPDAGRTWTAPREITGEIERGLGGFFWNVIAVGPGHGTVHACGRLLVPCWLAVNREDPFAHHPSVISMIYSDDGGETWDIAGIIDAGGLPDPNETCIAPLPDGRVLINVRSESPKKCRHTALSGDGLHWSQLKAEPALPDPVCCAGLCRAGGDLLFSNCENTDRRADLTLKRLSPEGGIREKLYLSEPGGYSDVCALADGTALVFYEADRDLVLARVRL